MISLRYWVLLQVGLIIWDIPVLVLFLGFWGALF